MQQTTIKTARLPIRKKLSRDLYNTWVQMKKHRTHYLFVAPFALVFFVFILLPVVVAICLGFTYFNMLSPPQFIGIENYFRMFVNDEVFMISVKNTLMFALITGPGGYVLSLLLAWLINDQMKNIRILFTLLFYAPSLTGGFTFVWTIMFSSDAYGYLNGILLKLGFIDTPVQWLKDTSTMIPIILFVLLWGTMGTSFLSFIAGLQGIDRQYYEAAALDGIRSRWQELWYITLPLMKPQLMFGAVMSITAAFNVGDVITGLVGNPSTDYAAHTVMTHMSDYGGTRFEMGYACAMATLLFIVMIVCNKAIQKLLSKVGS